MKRIAFHHIAKTAGSSVTDWLKRHFACKWETNGDNPMASVELFKQQPVEADLYTGHSLCELFSMLPCVHKLTVIREPDTRLASIYSYYRRIGRTAMPFAEWVAFSGELSVYQHATRFKFDSIGQFEERPKLFKHLASTLGVAVGEVPHSNPTGRQYATATEAAACICPEEWRAYEYLKGLAL